MKPADHNERKQAINPEQSYIIQAPAGSGKTELLIQRYLGLLALVDSPEEIIAITFTRKAAAEMQSRILAALELAQSDQEPQSEHQRVTRDLANAALKQNAEKAWNIVENPARLRIQTIDSLCAGLSRQMPVLSRLGAQPEIVDDAEPLYEQAAINTLAELESDEPYANAIATLLSHLDNDLPRIKSLIIDMLKKRDQWLRYVAQVHDRSDLEQSLQNVIEEELAQLVAIFPNDVETGLCSLLRYAAQHLKEDKKPNPIVHCESMTALPGDQVDDLEQWSGIVELLLTQKNTWRKSFTKTNGFPNAKENKLESEERASMKKRVEGLITRLREVEGLQHQLAEIRALPLPSYNDNEWEVVNALCVCLMVAEAQLRLCFAERNQIDYIGMAQAAIDALGEDDAPTDLALHLDYQIKHLLVDEFQDISINQHHLVTQLCHGWIEGDGRSLFLVGDPMQSIYRFREAEVGIFINTFHQQRLGQIPLVALRLSVNFRSVKGIIDWVNDCFSEIMPAQDEVGTGAVSYMPSTASHDEDTANTVNLYPLFNVAGLQEAQHVQDIVESIKQKEQNASITILVRSRPHLNEVIPLLRNAGVPFRAIEIEGLGQQPAIQDVLALTRAYVHPGDRIAWLAVLRAPWCGLQLKDLHALVDYENESTLWTVINNKERQQQLTKAAQARLEKIIQCFMEAFANQQRQSLRQTIETLWIRLGGPATLGSENDLENITTFFDLLERFDVGGSIEKLDQFIKNVKQLYAAPDKQAEDALQVMTIHKAKGLEFEHVIVPGLGRGQRHSQNDLLMWMLRPNLEQGNDLILAPINETGLREAAIYQYLNHIEKEKRSYEETRLLYVATTRAKKSLHLIGHAKLKQDKQGDVYCEATANSLLSHLWPVLKHEFEQIMPQHIESDLVEAITIVSNQCQRLTNEWQAPEPEANINWSGKQDFDDADLKQTSIEYEWAGDTIKHIGSVVHRCLQQIAEEGFEQWNNARLQENTIRIKTLLRQKGVPDDELGWAINRVNEALGKMLKDERGKWIFNTEYKEQHNEYPVSGLYQGKLINVIIDRTFIDEDGTRWIIDYKTSRHEGPDVDAFLGHEQERYREQLEKYAVLLQGMQQSEIKLGLYFPLLQGWREWSYN